MEATGGDQANEKTIDALTASISSEDSDSWTLLEKGADQMDKKPSGVQTIETEQKEEEGVVKKEAHSKRKLRHDSHRSMDSQHDESSDGISVISESDMINLSLPLAEDPSDDQCGGTVHFRHKFDSKLADPREPLTPPHTPYNEKPQPKVAEKGLQVQYTKDKSVETVQSVVEHHSSAPVTNARWIIFSVLATAMAAIIFGNSMRLQHHVNDINFEHEKRISELELENNILKNEMHKLRHLHTRSELDEQVQRAEFEWRETLQQKAKTPISTEVPHPEVETIPETTEQQSVRKIPPQDVGVKRKVVWSGDEEEPMLIVDTDRVLPAFCYNQEQAVHDDLFFEYSTKYCDLRKRKIEAKQKRTKFHGQRQSKQDNYDKFIHPKPAESGQENSVPVESARLASPFNIDYSKALDAIKAEGTVIVEILSSILDLSPEPEETFTKKSYLVPEKEENMAMEIVFSSAELEHPKQQKELREYDRQRSDKDGKNQPEGNGDDDCQTFTKVQQHLKRGSNENGRVDNRERGKNKKHPHADYYKKEKRHQQEQCENQEKMKGEDSSKQHHNDDDEGKHCKYTGDDNDGKHNKKYVLENEGQKAHDYHYINHPPSSGSTNDDDDGDNRHKKKFNARDKTKQQDQNKMRYDQHEHDNNFQQQRYSFDESSYVKQCKQDYRGNEDEGIDNYQKRHKQIYIDQQKHSEWNEKRYKGREEHRQNSKKQGEWHEKRYKGREEHRQNGGKHGEAVLVSRERHRQGRQASMDQQRMKMEHESNWYLERGTQREAKRT